MGLVIFFFFFSLVGCITVGIFLFYGFLGILWGFIVGKMMSSTYEYDVFLSHSSKDKTAVRALAGRLKGDGLRVWFDEDVIESGEHIDDAIERGLETSRWIVLFMSTHFFDSDWARLERATFQFSDPMNRQRRYIPLLLSDCDIPARLQGFKYVDYRTRSDDAYAKLLAALKPLSPPQTDNKLKVDLSHLPIPGAKLVGRAEPLADLDRYFADPEVAAVGIIAAGGVGKSGLVNGWIERLGALVGGVEVAYGWSFYSQGTHETQTSSANFFAGALPFFGHEGEVPKEDDNKALALINLLKKKTFLLVLDGTEPLQYPPDTEGGRFRDPGLYRLMRQLAGRALAGRCRNSLVMITSRQEIPTLAGHRDGLYRQIDLERLNRDDGRTLLQSLGVNTGLPKEYHDAVDGMGGHALGLVLLGNLLAQRHRGDIAHWPWVKRSMFAFGQVKTRAQKIMAHYDRDLWPETAPERLFLRLLGLFDRPMEQAAFQELKNKADIAKPLNDLADADFNQVLFNLQQSGLLLATAADQPFDAHPLVREYFGQTFEKEQPDPFKQAHRVLFDFFQKVPEKDQPDTLAELEPLYRAVHHGCRAGVYKQAMDDVLWERISRRDEYYSIKKLGAYSSDLAALSGFFPQGWAQPPVSEGLSEADQGWLLADASFTLMSLGRMADAVGPRRTAMEIREKLKDWENAARSARNLVELLLATGQLQEARRVAERGIGWAGKADDLFGKLNSQAYLATSLHRLGELAASETAFQESERLQKKWQPSYPQLYSLQGTQYAALLLDRAGNVAAREAVLERERTVLGWYEKVKLKDLLNLALNQLSLGRALAALGRAADARHHLEAAVAGIRQAGKIQYTSNFLLHRATFFRKQGDRDQAWTDLEEALEIAERCGMRLYEADAQLLKTRLLLDDDQPQAAAEGLRRGRALIEAMDYGQRRTDLHLAEAHYHHQIGDRQMAKNHLDRAAARIEEIGQHGSMPEVVALREEWGF